jgi:hypothetical protein
MQPHIVDWLRVVEAEYREIPGLNLTRPQVKRLWGLDEATCDQVLGALESRHVLRRTDHDGYVLGGERR